MKEDMLKTKRVLIKRTIVFWLKIIKIEKTFVTPKNTQDILSAFYYLQLSQY
jgi:hypothetical protein